jgi:pilus assembly protein CpaD
MTQLQLFLGAQARTMTSFARFATVSLAALALSGCANGLDPLGHTGGFSVIEGSQRHPILVSEQPASLSLKVARGSDGLTPHQRANVSDFLGRYRGGDTGNGRIAIQVPSGSANEVSALKAVADLREIVRDYGIDDTRVAVSPYNAGRDGHAPLRVSYTRFVAEAPECGSWPTNLADDARNLPYPNFACATQRNFAMQVANPADLLGPRTMTPAVAERRDVKWEKFNKSEVVISKKDQDERASVKSEN